MCKAWNNISYELKIAEKTGSFDEDDVFKMKGISQGLSKAAKSANEYTSATIAKILDNMEIIEAEKMTAKMEEIPSLKELMANIFTKKKQAENTRLVEKVEYHLVALLKQLHYLDDLISRGHLDLEEFVCSAELAIKYSSTIGARVEAISGKMLAGISYLQECFKEIQAVAVDNALQFHYNFFFLPPSFFKL